MDSAESQPLIARDEYQHSIKIDLIIFIVIMATVSFLVFGFIIFICHFEHHNSDEVKQ